MKLLVEFDLEFNLKFEISDGKTLVKFLGRTCLPARKARIISGQISEQILEWEKPQNSYEPGRLANSLVSGTPKISKPLFFGHGRGSNSFELRVPENWGENGNDRRFPGAARGSEVSRKCPCGVAGVSRTCPGHPGTLFKKNTPEPGPEGPGDPSVGGCRCLISLEISSQRECPKR